MNSYEKIYNLLVESDPRKWTNGGDTEAYAGGAAERAGEEELARHKGRGYGPNIARTHGRGGAGERGRRGKASAGKAGRRGAARAVGTPTNDPDFVSRHGFRPGGRSPRYQHLRRTQVTR
tara:strand:+ start:1049 stop:1408 length:360 start_codon:yes stop_codon:yes gene_type:complete